MKEEKDRMHEVSGGPIEDSENQEWNMEINRKYKAMDKSNAHNLRANSK